MNITHYLVERPTTPVPDGQKGLDYNKVNNNLNDRYI